LKNPGKYWFVSPFRTQGKENIWNDILKPSVPKPLIKEIRESELKVVFKNGAEIRLVGANNEEGLVGSGLKGIIFDEFADIDPYVWERLSPSLADNNGWAWFIGTPKGHNHFYEMFIKDKDFNDPKHRNRDGQTIPIDKDFKSFQFKTLDNPTRPDLITWVEKERLSMSNEMFKQEFEASFENYTGRIYKEYKAHHNILVPDLKTAWPVYIGIDTGRHTVFSFVTIDYEDRAYVFDEIYDNDSTVAQLVDQLKQKLKFWGIENRVHFIIDSASQVKREYNALGIYTTDSEKDVLNSIAVIRGRFQSNKLFFDSERCTYHISEHDAYEWHQKRGGKSDKPRPKKINDHTVNALQYVLNSSFVSKAYDESTISASAFAKKSMFDKDYEEWEDALHITYTTGGHPIIPNQSLHKRNSVTGY
jgi:hypothetical protein